MVAETLDTESPATRPKGVMSTIQVLRAVAALNVVFIHLAVLLDVLGVWRVYGGVDIFFVISGFVMVYTTSSKRVGAAKFMSNRIIRVAPLYWLLTFLIIVAAIYLPGFFKNTTADVGDIFKSLFFIPFSKDGDLLRPILYVGWTLNYEMFFYALFALGLRAENYLTGMCLTIGALVSLVVAGYLLEPTNQLARFYTDPILLEFGAGMLIGWFATRGEWRLDSGSRILWSLLGLAALAAVFYSKQLWPGLDRAYAAGIPATALVYAAVRFERLGGEIRNRLFLLLGDASYSLYLTHPTILTAFKVAYGKVGTDSSIVAAAFLIISLAACCAVAIASYTFLERPMTRWLRRKFDSGSLLRLRKLGVEQA